MKSMMPKGNNNEGEARGNSSNAEGNNSDSSGGNSGFMSLGNTSFGFNFDDSEEAIRTQSDQSDRDSDGNGAMDTKVSAINSQESSIGSVGHNAQHLNSSNETKSDRKDPEDTGNNTGRAAFHNLAAEAAVAELHSIALTSIPTKGQHEGGEEEGHESSTGKRSRVEDENCGYKSDDECEQVVNGALSAHQNAKPEEAASSTIARVHSQGLLKPFNSSDSVSVGGEDSRQNKKKKLDDKKREERNAREKERSFRISKQINELRALLSSGGVIVPKGTKSSVLTETANYIIMLQQHQYRSEIDRQQLIQQIQMIGGGAHGPQAAAAIRHVAAQNGVWTSDTQLNPAVNKSTVQFFPGSNPASNNAQNSQVPDQEIQPLQQTRIEDHEYRSVFDNCSVGMAIASMGGAFIDCNVLFCKLSNYNKQEVCALTIFNLTARQDLQHAFDLISQLISPSIDRSQTNPQPVVLRGAMNNGNDLGLSVTLVKAEGGIAKCFCVTLIKNPASPFDEARPVPATIELVHGAPILTRQQATKDTCSSLESAPAFTSG